MWPATAFSVARGSILEISSDVKFVWAYICYNIACAGNVYLLKINYVRTSSVYH